MARTLTIVVRHSIQLGRAGQLRFRLETFGLYYPALPYTTPWWRFSPRGLILFLRQLPDYARWLVEMEDVRGGGAVWWDQRLRELHK